MKIIAHYLSLSLFFFGCNAKTTTSELAKYYPIAHERINSNENAIYYIDPVTGSDENSGTKKVAPWKTFQRVNQLILAKGNQIEILSPGTFRESLFLIGNGTREEPIIVRFAPGEYNFYPGTAYKTKFHISNTNDAPDSAKAVAFYFLDSENIHVAGNGAEISFRGKTIETCINNCKNISIEDINFDYKRPTVSEMLVTKVSYNYADVLIHKDSEYEIIDSILIWVGEGWKDKVASLWQVCNREKQEVSRLWLPVETMRFSKLDQNNVRIYFNKNPGLEEGLIYQNRNTFRDYCAVFMQKSKNIEWNNVRVHFMHGMGFVSQFCENITYDSLFVGPKENSGRTSAAWADILHFSGCKGKIEVQNSFLSSANDDAINVHGTYLRIVDTPSKNIIKVRFMHPQTYGFEPFFAGDSLEFIRAKSLLPYSKNEVIKSKELNEKEFELTLKYDIPNDIGINDVVENVSWNPDVVIRSTKIAFIPTRGILVTSRGKVVIENNEFLKTHMSSILIADDAGSWFESGSVRDVSIRNNRFIDCKDVVIKIFPENSEIIKGESVHENIRIENNLFEINNGKALSVRNTANLKFSHNTIKVNKNLNISDLIQLDECVNAEIKDNKMVNCIVLKEKDCL